MVRRRKIKRAPVKPAFKAALALPKTELSITAPNLFRLLTAALLWTSHDVTRPHLNQVHFVNEGGKVAMFSTDGHALWFCDAAPFDGFDKSDEFSWGMSVEDAKSLLKLIRHRKEQTFGATDTAVFSRNEAGTTVKMGRCSYTFDAVGEAIPYRRVIPEAATKPATRVGVNGRYLAKVPKTLTGDGYNHALAICVGQELDAMRFDGTVGGVPASVIIMPLRLDGTHG